MLPNILFTSRSLKVVLAIAVSLTFISCPAFAQGWTKVATFDGLISLVKFVDQNNGFVGLGLSPGKPGFAPPPIEVYRTSDAGRTWIKCSTPKGYGGEIADIVMTDSVNGWLAMTCYGSGGRSALWRTTDGGWSWNATPLMGSGTSVAITSHAMVVTDLFGQGHLSTDGGATFTYGFPNSTNCASFVDDLHGVISDYRGLQWLVTSDGGLTWSPSSMNVEAWSVYGVQGTSRFYSAPEGWTNGTPYNNGIIYASNNYGKNFSQIATFPFRFNGHLAGIGDNILVFQVIDFDTDKDLTNHGGFYYSTNQGRSWKGIKGPVALNDVRFCLTDGCYGLRLYGFDDKPECSLWRYDFTAEPGAGTALPSFSSKTVSASVSLCRDTTSGFRIINTFCDSIVILSIKDLDSNSLAVTSGAFGFDSLRPMPFSMLHGTEDSIGFHWNPMGNIQEDTSFTIRLKVHYFSQTTDTTGDTIIPIKLSTIYSAGFALSALNVDMGTVSTCAAPDTTIVLANLGCVPIFIDSSAFKGLGFTLLDSIPHSIAPDDSARIRVRFNPEYGSNSGHLSLYVNNQGRHIPLYVDLTGTGVQGMGVLAMRGTTLEAGSFSFCAGDTLLTDTLRNMGCDTLVLSNIRFGGDSAFTLVSSPDSILLPGDSGVFGFLFEPRLKGPHAATLTFHSQNIVNDSGIDTSVTIFGIGLGGTTALSLDDTVRNFGALFECESRDTTIWLTNPGCDTLTVDSALFSNRAFSSLTSLPSLLLPGDSLPVKVHYMASSGSASGTVTFYTNANIGDSTATVPLQATVIPPAQLQLSLSPAQNAHVGQSVTFYIILTGDTGVAAMELAGVTFDLTHNDDLLSYTGASGVSLRRGTALHGIETDTLAWSAGSSASGHTDTIGTLKFQVYLTDSSETPLTISNISLQEPPDIPMDCIASVDSNASGFTYLYKCGEQTIQQFLQTGILSFHIESVVPNPATNSLMVSFIGVEPSLELVDVLGRQVLSIPIAPPAPSYSASLHRRGSTFDVSHIPSGVYYLRAFDGGYAETRRVVIER